MILKMGPGFFEEVADLIASNRFLEDEIEQDGKIRSGRLKAFCAAVSSLA